MAYDFFGRAGAPSSPEIGALGLDPDDADWAAIGWDWARPLHVEARLRLYGGLLASTKKAA